MTIRKNSRFENLSLPTIKKTALSEDCACCEGLRPAGLTSLKLGRCAVAVAAIPPYRLRRLVKPALSQVRELDAADN